jgi:hypothetical protein
VQTNLPKKIPGALLGRIRSSPRSVFLSGTISAINTLSAWAKNSSPNIAVAFLAHFRRPDGVLIFLLQLQGLTVVH